MKKTLILIWALTAAFGLKAQQPEPPMLFHNLTESLQYRLENPDGALVPSRDGSRSVWSYTQKLDSVIGADNFGWTRWKNIYAYSHPENESQDVETVCEIQYEWINQQWMPTLKTEATTGLQDGNADVVLSYRFNDGLWEPYYRVTSVYLTCGDSKLLESVTAEKLVDSAWVNANYATYEYDDNCHQVLNMNYAGVDEAGEWLPSSKYEYLYNEDGTLSLRTYSTIRNGEWRESTKDTLSYDANGLCTSLISRRRGGFGPGGNTWRDSNRYDFEYENGELVSEWYYTAGWGWLTAEMELDHKTDYTFDALGNMASKTASVFNESDWIVRDTYDNAFDASVPADEVLGLATVWEATLSKGMGYVLGTQVPLASKWTSCSIASTNLDTEFRLYCSGFASVDDTPQPSFRVYATSGHLMVESPEPCDITVYDLTGRLVASRRQITQCDMSLTPGLYFVGNGTQFEKVIIF